ncbi:MAG: AMP-binding protein [Ignavibacteriota bacterium]
MTFSELDSRVRKLVAALVDAGFHPGDRLALLLPNGPDYIALVYACAWLGVIAVPINVRLAAVEIDHVLADASPRGLVRHSSLPTPSVRLPWEVVLDQAPLPELDTPVPDPCYHPDAILAFIYTSGTTGRPKGVIVTHANILANVHNLNYWVRYREGGVYLHSAPIFHIAGFSSYVRRPGIRRLSGRAAALQRAELL